MDALTPRAALAKPLCVDLDGTLLNTDTLVEGLLALLSRCDKLGQLFWLPGKGRAGIKQNVARLAELAPELLPYNPPLLEYLQAEHAAGRRLVLATAADAQTAQSIADHLGLFDEVIASDGSQNNKGEAKARELVRRYGHRGFDYAGDSRADLPVWRNADGIVIVNAAPAVARAARRLGNVVAEITRPQSRMRAALGAMRPHQWVKNLLVFVPLLTSRSFANLSDLAEALIIFVSFCATASAIYLINDLLDLNADRQHPRKRHRPLASGALPLPLGAGLAAVLLALGLALALPVGATTLMAVYACMALGYSLAFKQYPLLDVFILAALYTLRVLAGGVATGHTATLWLLAFSGFIFLSLALVKRVTELFQHAPGELNGKLAGRGYRAADQPMLQMFGISASFASSVVLALFVSSSAALQTYRSPEILWALVPLILFWQLRLWLATLRGHMHDDPIVYALGDWVSRLVGIVVVAVVLLAWRMI